MTADPTPDRVRKDGWYPRFQAQTIIDPRDMTSPLVWKVWWGWTRS